MKLSEAIERLSTIKDEHGDLDLVVAQKASEEGIEIAPFISIGYGRLLVPEEKSFACVTVLELPNDDESAPIETD